MARRLSTCKVLTEGNGVSGDKASDHYPVLAEFGEYVNDELDNDRGDIAGVQSAIGSLPVTGVSPENQSLS
jgi:hypothetical protein